MDASQYTFDLANMFFGDFSAFIYLEILIRVSIIMMYTVLIMRWIGKRAVGTLGSSDVLLIIAMGSAVGDATFYPDVPLAVPITAITLIAAFQRLYIYIGIKGKKKRIGATRKVVKLVESGRILSDNLTIDDIEESEVYMLLREAGIHYLSEVEHAYYEQSGHLSIYTYDHPKLENSILPEDLDNK